MGRRIRDIFLCRCCLAFLLLFGTSPARSKTVDQAHLRALFQDLQRPHTSAWAAEALIIAGRSNAARTYISAHLPHLLAVVGEPKVWLNEVKIAGDLKLQSCIPPLTAVMVRGDGIGVTTAYTHVLLKDDPAGTALVKMGDLTIPFMNNILSDQSSPLLARQKAILVLISLRSARSQQVLREYFQKEGSPYLKRLIATHAF